MNTPVRHPLSESNSLLDQHAAHKVRQSRMIAAGLEPKLQVAVFELQAAKREIAELRLELDAAKQSNEQLRHRLGSAAGVETCRPWREIASEVCGKHGFSLIELRGNRRYAPLVRARHELFFRLSSETIMSLPQIGRICGGKDHTTILHGIRRHAARFAIKAQS